MEHDMIIIFPRYDAHFVCACTLQEATKRITEEIAQPSNNLKMMKATYCKTQKIVFSAGTGEILYRNSFLPITTIEIKEVNEESFISMSFELQKSVKTMFLIYSLLAVLFGVSMFASTLYEFWQTNQFTTTIGLLCAPFGTIILLSVLNTVGLKLSSKSILKIMFSALARESIDHIPPIHSF